MRQEKVLRHEFVEHIPTQLEDGTIYISVQFATAVHRCCCGCGNEVVTPLSPTDWTLIFDGDSVSLDPSIGNWGFACQSHYWIRRSRVKWAPRWSRDRIRAGRAADSTAKERYFGRDEATPEDEARESGGAPPGARRPIERLWSKLKSSWFRKRN